MEQTKVCPVCVQLAGLCPDCYCLSFGLVTCELQLQIDAWEQSKKMGLVPEVLQNATTKKYI